MAMLYSNRETTLKRIREHCDYLEAVSRVLKHADYIAEDDMQLGGDFEGIPDGVKFAIEANSWGVTFTAYIAEGTEFKKADVTQALYKIAAHWTANYLDVIGATGEDAERCRAEAFESVMGQEWEYGLSGGSWRMSKFASFQAPPREESYGTRKYMNLEIYGVQKSNCIVRKVKKEIEVYESVCEGDPNYEEAKEQQKNSLIGAEMG